MRIPFLYFQIPQNKIFNYKAAWIIGLHWIIQCKKIHLVIYVKIVRKINS